MTDYTTTAFIHHGTWSAETKAHPALEFLQHWGNEVFDKQAWKTDHWSDWHTEDYTLTKPDGSVVKGGHEAWTEGNHSIFGDFTGHQHDPIFFVVWETKDGWELIGEADVYGDLHQEGEGDTVKDKRSGKEWHAVMHGSYHFEFVKHDGKEGGNKFGILVKSMRIYADSHPMLGAKIKRGVVKKEHLGFD